ncbi:nuclear transport factor 2 family protein [Bosea psychrotolerans]|uniref:SnoaL-like protein n=1 Tax=Bosea psychrotolerans TaxID=1871628 RepID=A0A2S4MDG1_9HYPH|nr:nuclear transport factor 2 family protein [Bosea psychrotolerans]POR52655.1 SnoaL-like protein [Bosea psychrotolerans]
MNLPNCIKDYFDADSRNDPDALVATLSTDAIVEDERMRHVGADAIRKWWAEAKQKTPHVNEPIDAATTGNVTRVRAKVSGEFPGSPVTLQFAFTVQDDRIVRLEIA